MLEITNLIHGFANCFDLKDWKKLQTLLCNTVECDYSSLRGVKELLSPSDYTAARIKALQSLKTQHLFANLEIYPVSEGIQCRCQAYIRRRNETEYFNTHAIYEFELHQIKKKWRIAKIKQTVLWNEGNPSIHKGIN